MSILHADAVFTYYIARDIYVVYLVRETRRLERVVFRMTKSCPISYLTFSIRKSD